MAIAAMMPMKATSIRSTATATSTTVTPDDSESFATSATSAALSCEGGVSENSTFTPQHDPALGPFAREGHDDGDNSADEHDRPEEEVKDREHADDGGSPVNLGGGEAPLTGPSSGARAGIGIRACGCHHALTPFRREKSLKAAPPKSNRHFPWAPRTEEAVEGI